MKHYENRYNMTAQESRFLVKKKWDENIYCGMKMEGRAVTFPQTRTILDGVNVPGVQLDDVQAILNMRDAWRFVLGSMDETLSLDYICRINAFVARNEALAWGTLRTGRVGISGTDYVPPIPNREECERELAKILTADDTATAKALAVFAWGTRAQLFWDGNKRTSLIAANKILLMAGAGMLTVREQNIDGFNAQLLDYYNTGEAGALLDYLYENAIQGIEY